LPHDFPAAVLIVLHIGPSRSILPSILGDAAAMEATHARHGELIEPGHIYIAPPDRHLLVGVHGLELSRGPRENWARPAIDPLFRTAAEIYGPDVVGIVLSGRLNDGTAGLYEIKRRGGIAIVQDPREAEAESMPRSAFENVPVDYCLPVVEIPTLLVRLVRERAKARLAAEEVGMQQMQQKASSRPVALTCPECGGAMREETVGNLTRYRCHTGHTLTAEIMAAAQVEDIEKDLGAVLRALNERVELCSDMAAKGQASGNQAVAEMWQRAAEEAAARESDLKRLLAIAWTHPEASAEAGE
jgi:two-component system chemotaxis response regulator CheB